MSFEILTADEAPGWDEFLAQQPRATIFHTREMVRVFADTRSYEPLALAARASDGRLVAILVAVRVATIDGLLSRFAARSILLAEPLCTDDQQGRAGLAELINHHDRAMRGRTLFCEVRPMTAPGPERAALESRGYEWLDYLNYITDVTHPEDVLWRRLKKSFRRDIRRTGERGLVLREENDLSGVDRLYRMLQVSYGRSKVPMPDKSLFQATLAHLPSDWYRIVIACLDGEPVASSIDLIYNGVVLGWYGGTKRIQGVAANACITWDSILWGARHGQRLYDSGGAGWPDIPYGPREFKAKFGGELVRHGRYRKVYSAWKLALADRAYRGARALICPKP